MLVRRVFPAFGRSLRDGWRRVRRTCTNETFVTTAVYIGSLLTLAAGVGLIYPPLGVIAAGCAGLGSVVLYLRARDEEEQGAKYRPPGRVDEDD